MIGERKSQQLFELRLNGLLPLRTLEITLSTLLKKLIGIQNGVKHVSTTCLLIVKIGVSLDKGFGVSQFQSFMRKMESQSLRMKRLSTLQGSSMNMDQIFGSSGMPRTYFLKGLLRSTVQRENLQRKLTLWMFGSIQGLPMKQF